MAVSRKVWRDFDNHRLSFIGQQLGIEYLAHDALEDARTCGVVVAKAAEKIEAINVRDLLKKISYDENNIIWIKPKAIKYLDINGKQHNYIPDFYLPQYDVYLDPKNDYLIKNNYNSKYEIIWFSDKNVQVSFDEYNVKVVKVWKKFRKLYNITSTTTKTFNNYRIFRT